MTRWGHAVFTNTYSLTMYGSGINHPSPPPTQSPNSLPLHPTSAISGSLGLASLSHLYFGVLR